MKRILNVNYFLTFFALIFPVFFLTGCQNCSWSPDNIKDFDCVKENMVYRCYFFLEDLKGNNYGASGLLKIRIYETMLGRPVNLIYKKDLIVNPSDFVDYEFKLTGTYLGKAFEFRIPVSEINKTYDGKGKIYIKFITCDGKNLTAEVELEDLPKYTLKELAEIEKRKKEELLNKKNYYAKILASLYQNYFENK